MSDDIDSKRFAPDGAAWVCGACGKISPHDRYGDKDSSRGWDSSCMLNAVLCDAASIEREPSFGTAINARALESKA